MVRCSHPQHTSLSMRIKLHGTTHHITFHNPSQLTNTEHVCVSGGKMAQEVGMV